MFSHAGDPWLTAAEQDGVMNETQLIIFISTLAASLVVVTMTTTFTAKTTNELYRVRMARRAALKRKAARSVAN